MLCVCVCLFVCVRCACVYEGARARVTLCFSVYMSGLWMYLMSVMMCLMHADERMYNCVSDDMSMSHNVQESKLNMTLKT